MHTDETERATAPRLTRLERQGGLHGQPGLQNSADPRQAVWEASPDAMVLSEANGVVLAVNPACCSLSGYGPDELVGLPFTRIVPEPQRQATQAQLRATFATAEPGMLLQMTLKRKDGSSRIVDSRIGFIYADSPEDGNADSASAGPPVSAERRIAMLSIMRDVTDSMPPHHSLRATLQRERAMVARNNEELVRVLRDLERIARQLTNGVLTLFALLALLRIFRRYALRNNNRAR